MSIVNNDLPDVRALEAFAAAMASGSMTSAARQLGTGQPTVTRLVRDLEETVGFALFHRNGPRISPTDQGLRFYEEAQRVLASLRQISERAAAIRDERLASIDIAMTPAMAGGLLGPALSHMSAELPAIINVQTMDAEHVVRTLRARMADFGVSAFPLDHAGLTCHLVCESQLVAALPEASALAQEDTMPLTALAENRLVTLSNPYRVRRLIEAALSKAGVRPRSELATNSSLNAIAAARAGLGIAIVDPVSAFGIGVKGVAIRPLDVAISYSWGLFSATGRVLSEPLQDFISAFRSASAETVPGCVIREPDAA
ncbi:LysR family transcriptional regulator [Consotaella aegiceratis]|uniref:LysR family transcriptional regulator n=1 Tax=Consotaella aegiceratis TaxID=3097961 RepID=UPI002F3F514F